MPPLQPFPASDDARASVLVFSPHLDDAVLSVGATMAALTDAGHRVKVVTVFAGLPGPSLSPASLAFHDYCGLAEDAVQVRRSEDMEALAELGAHLLHLPFLDAIYRRLGGRWLCDRPGALFDAAAPCEPHLWSQIRALLEGVIKASEPVVVLTCRALGGHVDHRLVRSVAEVVCSSYGAPLLLWEDLPYSFDAHPRAGWVSMGVVPPGPDHIKRKVRAIARYSSQLRMLAEDETPWPQRFMRHHQRRAVLGVAEPLWPAVTDRRRTARPLARHLDGGLPAQRERCAT